MSSKSELEAAAAKIFGDLWSERNGQVVPSDESIALGNDGVHIDATVLYADLSDSTNLVDSQTQHFAAEVYKAYLSTAGRIIRDEGGTITAYDGDRIMAVFIGNSKNTSAVTAALKLNFAVSQIIQPKLKKQYPNQTYVLKQTVGIDTSDLFVAKTGVRGANDLVWVGRAANHAAKLSALSDAYPTYITADVYSRLRDEAKTSKGVNMWEARTWTWNQSTIYRTTYYWTIT